MGKLKKSDSYIILEELMQKRLLVIKPKGLISWLSNLENTGQITEQESKDLLTLAELLDIYNVPFTEHSFMRLRTNLYLHPCMLPKDPILSTLMGAMSSLIFVKDFLLDRIV